MSPTRPPHFQHWPPLVPRHLTLPQTNVFHNAEVSAARYPDKPAGAWWIPQRLGGSAPTPEEALQIEERVRQEKAERRAQENKSQEK